MKEYMKIRKACNDWEAEGRSQLASFLWGSREIHRRIKNEPGYAEKALREALGDEWYERLENEKQK